MSDHEAAVEEVEKPKQMNIALLLLISLALFNAAFVLNEAFRWSNPIEGFMNGLIHGLFISIPYLIVAILWSVLAEAVCTLFKWRRVRSHAILLPAYAFTALMVVGFVMAPPTAERRFESRTGIELPKNALNLECHFFGGGFVDYTDRYYFQTTPDEVERLIEGMELKEGQLFRGDKGYLISFMPLPDCPDFNDWPEAKLYSKFEMPASGWFYYLITDDSRTKVYIMIGCI